MVPLATPARRATSSSRAAAKPLTEILERRRQDRLAPLSLALRARLGRPRACARAVVSPARLVAVRVMELRAPYD
jgi:hypothetical protein